MADSQLESWPVSLPASTSVLHQKEENFFFLYDVETSPLKEPLKIWKGLIFGFRGTLWRGGSDLLELSFSVLFHDAVMSEMVSALTSSAAGTFQPYCGFTDIHQVA